MENEDLKELNKPRLLSVNQIWDKGAHNAFTDLIHYQGKFFLAFREGDEHADGKEGIIRILSSLDGITWESAALLKKKGFDLRDPHFSITPDKKLMLSLDGSVYGLENEDSIEFNSMVAFSENGQKWSKIQNLQLKGEWIWRVSWYKGIGYGVSYRLSDIKNIKKPWIATLFSTIDGINFTPITVLDSTDHASETTLRFQPDGIMVAMMRRKGNGWIGTASPPYTNWKWSETETQFGGPNFLILRNGKMWGSSRLIKKIKNKTKTYTAIGPMTPSSYTPELILPSEGDTGYPGMVYHKGILYVSYYSSHEGQSNIYIAQIKLPKFQNQEE